MGIPEKKSVFMTNFPSFNSSTLQPVYSIVFLRQILHQQWIKFNLIFTLCINRSSFKDSPEGKWVFPCRILLITYSANRITLGDFALAVIKVKRMKSSFRQLVVDICLVMNSPATQNRVSISTSWYCLAEIACSTNTLTANTFYAVAFRETQTVMECWSFCHSTLTPRLHPRFQLQFVITRSCRSPVGGEAISQYTRNTTMRTTPAFHWHNTTQYTISIKYILLMLKLIDRLSFAILPAGK